MAESLVNPLPHFCNQFETGRSQFRCAEAAEVMCADYAYPRKFNLNQTMHDEYVRNAGNDVPSNQQGTSIEQVEDFFRREYIGYVNMPVHDLAWLFAEMEAQNAQGYLQFLTIANEADLLEYGTNAVMHNWPCEGFHHCIVRLGCSDSEPFGYYFDPAASKFCFDSATGKAKPVKIGRQQIESAGIMSALCIMKPGVPAPPSGFSFQHGTWPAPKPAFDAAKAQNTISAMAAAMDALKAAVLNLGNDLNALKVEESSEKS